jgi:uncharacterized membrane-anchored protein
VSRVTAGRRSAPASAGTSAPVKEAAAPVVTGQVRLGRRTKHLVKRLEPGEIAVISHRDLDRVSGEDLVA